MLYDHRMAERVRVTRFLILIGFLVAAVGFGLISSWALPDSLTLSSYQLSELVGFVATGLFWILFGWAFWVWLPRLGESYGALNDQRRALQLFAVATMLLAMAYAAESYQLVQELLNTPFAGRSPNVVAAGYSVVVIGFGAATVGFWATSTAGMPDGIERSDEIRGPLPFRARTNLIGVGLFVGAVGWVVSIWPERAASDGMTAKSVLIFGFANAAGLVVMAAGFGLLLRRRVPPGPGQAIRAPLSILGCAFLALVASNLAFLYQELRVFSGLRSAIAIGSALQGAGALASSVGFFALAWAAGSTHHDRKSEVPTSLLGN